MNAENKTTELRVHHARSMSQWSPILECACFEGAAGNAAAEFGTETHAVLQKFLETGDRPPAENLFQSGALKFGEKILATLETAGAEKNDLKIEAECKLKSGIFGFCDAAFLVNVSDSEIDIYVFDFKTFKNSGRDHTPQLAGYALALAESQEKKVRDIYLFAGYGDAPAETTSVKITLDKCKEIHKRVVAAFDARDAGTATPKQCNWCEICKHFATCAENTRIAKKVSTDFASVPEKWEELSTVSKAQMTALADAVAKWAAIVKAKAKETLLDGGTIESEENGIKYILRHTAGRKTPRTQDACNALVSAGVPAQDVKDALKISAADCKTLLKNAGKKGKEVDEIMNGFCDVGESTETIVRK